MHRTACGAIFIALLLAALTHSPVYGQTPTRRALLIGINDYKYVDHLFGCLNDIDSIKQLLINKYHFLQANITAPPQKKANRDGILKAFRQLITTTNPGDEVLIYYSGHGSRIQDRFGTKPQDMDECIIPYDYSDTGVLPIADKQLAYMLDELSGKTDHITVILDCCHSGSGTKLAGTKIRSLPDDNRKMHPVDTFLPPLKGGSQQAVLKTLRSSYVLLAACLNVESAYEKQTGTITQGEMSYYLLHALQQGDNTLSWRQVCEDISPKVHKDHSDQTVQLEGLNRNAYVFGSRYMLQQPYLLLQNGTLTLKGGEMVGVTAGSLFSIYPQGTIDFTGKAAAQVKVVQVQPITSTVTLVSGKIHGDNCRAVETTPDYANGELTVRFYGDWTGTAANVQNAVSSIKGISTTGGTPDIGLLRKGDSIHLFLGADTSHPVTGFRVEDNKSPAMTALAITHWLKWFHIKHLQNPNPRGKPRFSIQQIDKEGHPAQENEASPYADSTTIYFKVINQGFAPIYITVADLQLDGSINVIPMDSLQTGKNAQELILGGDSACFPLQLTIQQGYTYGLDDLKFFVTEVVAPELEFLEKPSVFKEQRDYLQAMQKNTQKGIARSALSSEDRWDCTEKIYQTTIQHQ